MTRTWIGVAMRDRMGNWSSNMAIVSRYTKPVNPLSLTVEESGTNGILNVTVHGHRNLNSLLVDTVRIFYRSDASLFSPRSYDPAQLKLSLSLSSLIADSVISFSNMEGETPYYFAVNERAVVNGAILYGDIQAANKSAHITGDYAEPQNARVVISSSSADTIVARLTEAQFVSQDVASVYIYLGTNSSYLQSSYKLLVPVDTLTRAEALLSSPITFSSLAEGTRYFVGVAVKDSSGNWCTSLSIDSARTSVRNTLVAYPTFNPASNRRIGVTFTGAGALSGKVDSVRLFYGAEQILDPFSQSADDTILPKSALSGTIYLPLPDGLTTRIYTTVSPFVFEEGKRWMAGISAGTVKSVWYDSDEPFNPISLNVADTSLTTITVNASGWAALFGSDVDSVLFWVRKMNSSADSVLLSSQHALYIPGTALSLPELAGGTTALLSGLDTGSVYYVGVAPRDSNGNYASSANVYRFRTASRPLNPLSVSGDALYYSTAKITVGNINSLAPNIERTKVKLILSTTGYVQNGYDSTNARYVNAGTDSASRSFVITGLKHSTKYFVSIAVSNTRGYWSRIAIPANVCTLRTPAAADTLFPDGSALTFSADTSPYQPYTQIAFKIRGLNSLPAGDRFTGGVRVYWSENSPYTDFQFPSKDVGYTDIPLVTMPEDTFDGIVYPLLAGSYRDGHGKRYSLSFAVRDSAYNWDTLSMRTATGWTRMDPVRPVNDTGWNPVVLDYNRVTLNWNPAAFNKTGITFRDTVVKFGVWLTSAMPAQGHIDTATPFIQFDSGASSPLIIDGLTHNTNYYVSFAPINTIGNRGAVDSARSTFYLKTPFDSSTIAQTPNLCSLSVAYTSMPDTLAIKYKLSSLQFTDPVNGITMPVKQVVIRYRTDGIYPSGPADGSLAKLISVTSLLTDSFKLSPVLLGAEYRFTAFTVSSLSSVYPNRFSSSASHAMASIRAWSYPANNLSITRLVPQGGLGNPVRVAIDWRVASGSIPAAVRFLYKQFSGYDDVPAKVSAPGFASFEPLSLAYSRRDTVPVVLQEQTKYVIAAFARNSDGVWSKLCIWDTITTPRGIDTLGPSKLPLEVRTRVVDSRTVRVSWRIDPPLFYAAQYSENDKLSLLLDWNNSGPDFFLAPTLSRPYRDSGRISIQRPVDSILITDLDPGKDYYFAMSTSDSIGNQARTDSLSVSLCRLEVPGFHDSLIKISLPDNERVIIDWTNLINADTKLWKADSQIKFLTFVVQADSAYTGAMPSSEVSGSGRIVRCVEAATALFSERLTRFDDKNHYITFWPSVERFQFPGSASYKGPIRYKIDKPRLEIGELKQISDTVLRIIVSPFDSTERDLQIRTAYNTDGSTSFSEFPAAAIRTGSHLRLATDTVVSGRICTSYVHINRLPSSVWNKIRGSDSVRISISLSLSDLRPVTQLHPDTVYILSNIIDNKAPGRSLISINYNRSTRRMVVKATSVNRDFSTLSWKTENALPYKIITLTDSLITVDTAGVNRIFIRLADSLGNKIDTSWEDFQSVRLPFKDSLYNVGTKYFDNGALAVNVPVTALNSVPLNYGYLTIGLLSEPLDSVVLRNRGFVRTKPETYYFISELRAASQGTMPFYNTGINLSFRQQSADTSIRLYRYTSGYGLEELSTIIDSGGKIIKVENLAPVKYWNSTTTASAQQEDTFFIVALRDLRAPYIDTVSTGLYLSDKGDSGSIRLRVRDNNIRLNAGVRLFTYRPSASFGDTLLWDTTTNSLSNDTISELTFDVTSILRANKDKIGVAGVHMALWVNDGRTRTLQNSASVALDSLTGVYTPLRPAWQIISLTANLNEFATILDIIPELAGEYNRDRIRIHRLDGNTFKEYSSSDFGFKAGAGSAFIALVRKDADISLSFKTGACKLPAVKNNRGFVLANGGTAGGWRLVSLPFMGSVKQSAIVAASRIDTGTGKASLYDRMWVLRNNTFQLLNPVPALADSFRLRAVKGYGDGVLLYLYPNEEIVAPITDNGNYAYRRASAKVSAEIDWRMPFSVSMINEQGQITGTDAMNAIGTASENISFSDLSFPDAPYAGLIEGGALQSMSYKKRGGDGWIWKLHVSNNSSTPKGVRIDFRNTFVFPEGIKAVLDVPEAGYSVDITGNEALFSDNMNAISEKEYPVIVGDSAFVARNSSAGKAPASFAISGNYPNPFNPVTMVNFQLPRDPENKGFAGSRVVLDVYDIRGKLIKQLHNSAARTGRYNVMWNGRNSNGSLCGTGVYIYRITVSDSKGRKLFTQSKRMTLVK
ncbi:MAG: hypothetical protein JNL74_05130 [Fibrobacteres bacterium]|nr:hypothetical protein [Fibrobacterota bacterium]